MLNKVKFGQQFLIQAPQPQIPGLPNSPFVPALSPPPLVPAFPSQPPTDQLSLSNPVKPIISSEEAVEAKEPPIEQEQPEAIQVGTSDDADISDEDGTILEESTSIDLEAPVLMNLKTTTKEDFTILSGQDLGDLLKAAGPELLQKLKDEKGSIKHHKKEETDNVFDGENNSEVKNEAAESEQKQSPIPEAPAINPFPFPAPLSPFMPQAGAFNILG